MTNNPTVVAPYYQGWDVYQQHLIDVIAPLTSEQLDLRVAPHLRSVGMIAMHIVLVRAGWLYYVLNVGGDVLGPIGAWASTDQQVRSPAELVDGLRITWQVIEDVLNRWSYADLQEMVTDVEDDGTEVLHTRQWVLWRRAFVRPRHSWRAGDRNMICSFGNVVITEPSVDGNVGTSARPTLLGSYLP